ncbi:hypothetical protein ACFYVR_04150 [Rhodococcus sp. NPDC003318]|uniref:hypothetical protein n=1 Tax=Rhodococcus sp. NPDC003318 TaxID=3364503 RepID=UPI0036BF29F4
MTFPIGRLAARLAAALPPVLLAASALGAPAASATELDEVLNLPLTNRLADQAPGGVHAALPTDLAALESLVAQARRSGRPATDYAALLLQYRLVQATTEAGIDLAGWDPSAGFIANRDNMIRSYRYYENFQLAHRELLWAGMGGMVGGDFGGGIADMELANTVYGLPGLQDAARSVLGAAESAFGPAGIEQLPGGLRTLAERASDLTTADLDWFVRRVVIMQKAIFDDLMPMHYAYTHEGLAAIDEYHAAGVIPDDVRTAWYDIASREPDRVAAGNTALLRREQLTVVGELWDETRAYRDGLGGALTYAMTMVGSPSLAGVPPLRNHRPITVTGTLPDGRSATLTTPLPAWDWSVFDERWAYVDGELLPRYRDLAENHWPTLEAVLEVPYEHQFESQRATARIPQIVGDVAAATTLTVH